MDPHFTVASHIFKVRRGIKLYLNLHARYSVLDSCSIRSCETAEYFDKNCSQKIHNARVHS